MVDTAAMRVVVDMAAVGRAVETVTRSLLKAGMVAGAATGTRGEHTIAVAEAMELSRETRRRMAEETKGKRRLP